MINRPPLDFIPLWGVFILTGLILYLASWVGFRLGKVVEKRWPDLSETSVGVMVGAALALLGFLLAFVTSLAIDIFNDRRQLVISEANAIGTAYLRAGFLSQPGRDESRHLLRDYVDLRIEALDPARTGAAITRSEMIHDELWRRAEEEARENPVVTVSSYVQSLNDVIDLHTERLNAELGFRIPDVVLFGLYGVAILTMVLVGVYNSYHEKQNLIAQIIVVLILALIFIIIVDLDRSNIGLIKVPQQALIELQQRLNQLP
jgi:hypothetical protein